MFKTTLSKFTFSVFILIGFGSIFGCKKMPQHAHYGPEHHNVSQSLTVPIEIKQSHDSDSSQKLSLSPTSPKLNLNFPGKFQSNTNTNTFKSNKVFNGAKTGEEPPPYN